jgi:glycolate oxidase FAD binding subunit
MIVTPSNAGQLAQSLAEASARKEKIQRLELGALDRVVEHTPEDMTVTVEAGRTLSALQATLARHRQWLPLDPPRPEQLTISELINANASGPRRFGCGTVRDFLIGITVALADGRIIHSGGKVVKNVAGYDLAKLFIGARGSLGVVVETTFKLRPLPEVERFVQAECAALDEAGKLLEAVFQSEITPVVADLHRMSIGGMPTLVLGFAGTREEVEWQLTKAGQLGIKESSSLEYETSFWAGSGSVNRLSVLPSSVVSAIRGLSDIPFVARAGNGVVYHRGAAPPRDATLPLELMRRVKDSFDPHHILPEIPL